MPKALRSRAIDVPPISGRSVLSDLASVPCHNEETCVPDEPNTCQDTVYRQVIARLQPWCDTKIDRERKSIPDQHACRYKLASEFGIAGDCVCEGGRDANGAVEGDSKLCYGEREPVEMVCNGTTVQCHGERHQEYACDEDVQSVLWLGDTVVATCKTKSQDLAHFSDVETTARQSMLALMRCSL